MRLTNGEGWWLLRRRLGLTMAEACAKWNVSEDQLRAWEKGREDAPSPGTCSSWTPLTPGEYSTIARRRRGWTAPYLALKLGISRQTLLKREHDRTSSADTLARHWARRGFPDSNGVPAPLRIGAPPL